MTDSRRDNGLDGLIGEIVATAAQKARRQGDFSKAAEEIKALIIRDYGPALRNSLARSEVKELISEARRSVWPQLNQRAVTLVSPREFTRRWSSTGVEFRLAKFSSAAGLALLGFYVNKSSGLKRPLICVNTAHHQAAIGAAFAHEMGHHLTSEIFGSQNRPSFLLYTGIGEHLDDPAELAADLLVSLGMYPQPLALASLKEMRKVSRARKKEPIRLEDRFNDVLTYCSNRYGLKFDSKISPANRLQYLAGLVHYTKLRQALLDEYDL
jgi:hypothetical protein